MAAECSFDPIAYINEPRWRSSHYGLERIRALLDRLGRPQDSLRFVHVAGTNGKGSTCAYIARALRCAGYRTGLFTSPYIVRFEERIQVDGRVISPDDLRAVTLDVRDAAEALYEQTGDHATEFELMCAVALVHFARQCCDVVVLEVGMGGRLDSTNVIDAPEVCVICRIGLDHTAFLGDTLPQIAVEKAGIIKPGASVVSYPQDTPETQRVIGDAARTAGCELTVADFDALEVGRVECGVRSFSYKGERFRTRLLGSYQPRNAAVAIEALRALGSRGWNVTDAAIERGVAETSWPGRFEVVQAGPPTVIVDGGHNPQGAAALRDSLDDVFPNEKVAFVMSVLADKDYRAMVRAVLPRASAFYCVTPPNPRALSAEDLAAAIAEEEAAARRAQGAACTPAVPAAACANFEEAFAGARDAAGADGVVCAFGSLYSIAEELRALGASA